MHPRCFCFAYSQLIAILYTAEKFSRDKIFIDYLFPTFRKYIFEVQALSLIIITLKPIANFKVFIFKDRSKAVIELTLKILSLKKIPALYVATYIVVAITYTAKAGVYFDIDKQLR